MRNIRKIFAAGAACIACAAGLLGLSACKSADDLPEKSDVEYEWTYVKEFTDEADADMKIDGVIDEKRWENSHWLYHGEDDVRLQYTTAFSQKGLYIAAKAYDTKMQWNARFNFSHWRGTGALNSAFWFQIDGPAVVDGHAMRQFNFFVDPFNKASRNQTRFDAKAVTNGDIRKGEATEMTAELFVSWDALNVDLGEQGELPEFVYVTPCYRFVAENNASCADNRWIIPTGTYPMNTIWWNEGGYARTLGDFNYYRAKTGIHFNKDGYINYDREGSNVGMGSNGMCKSDGWDLTHSDAGEYSVVSPYEQYLFVKDVYAERYYFKTNVRIDPYADGNPGNEWPSLGLATVKTSQNQRCFYISGNGENSTALDREGMVYKDEKSGRYRTFCNSIDFTSWQKNSFGNVYAPAGKDVPNEGFALEIIKNGSVIYYIVEGQLVGTDNVIALAGKACPALFSIGGRGTFSDLFVETDGLKIDAEIAKYARKVMVNVKGSGVVEPNLFALKTQDGQTKENLVLNILADVNYAITDISVTGADFGNETAWDAFCRGYESGVWVIPAENIAGDISVEATFTRLSKKINPDNLVELNGILKKKDLPAEAFVGTEIEIYDVENNVLYYKQITSSIGKYALRLPKAGEYDFDGHTICSSGRYNVKALGADGYKSLSVQIDVNNAESGKLNKDFELEKLDFRPTEIASSRYSSGVQYTLNNSYLLRGAYYFEEKSVGQGEDFLLYATVDPKESSSIATEIGFVAGTGYGASTEDGHCLLFALKNAGGVYSVNIWTEGGKNVSYNATNVSLSGEMKTKPFGENKDRRLDIALGYSGGKYTLYFNGYAALTMNENDLMTEGYPRMTYKDVIGSAGKKKLGLLSLNADTAFYEWGFDMGEEVNMRTVRFVGLFGQESARIVKHGGMIFAPETPVERKGYSFLGWYERAADGTLAADATVFPSEGLRLYEDKTYVAKYAKTGDDFEKCELDGGGWVAGGNGDFNYSGGTANVKGSYLFKDFVTRNTAFALYCTIAPSAQQVGFVLSGGGSGSEKNYLQFVYRPNLKDIYLWSDKGGAGMWWELSIKDKLTEIAPYGEDGKQNLEMALVYKDGTYSVYMNGVLAANKKETDVLWGVSVAQAVGMTNAEVYLGLASREGRSSFVNWGYTTNAEKIAAYFA